MIVCLKTHYMRKEIGGIKMVKVVAKHYVKEEMIQKYIDSAEELISATVKETGCIKYELYQDEKDKSILTIIEEWENKAVLGDHMNSEHFKRLVPLMGEMLSKPTEMNVYSKIL